MRGPHTLRNDLAHTGQLDHGVAFHQFQTGALGSSRLGSGSGGSGLNRRCGSSGSSSLLSLGSSQNVSLTDTTGGAGTGKAGVIYAQLGSGLACQRRNADPGAVCSGSRCGNGGGSCGRGGRGRSGLCRGSSGSSTANGFAGLTDISQQTLNRDVLPFLCHDLQQRALVFADHFVGQLIGGDLQNGIAHLDSVTFLLEPGGNGAFFHGQTQLGHQNFICHDVFLLTCSARA